LILCENELNCLLLYITMANDPFSGTNTRNILEHLISPKIVGATGGGYQVKTDLINVDTAYPNNVVVANTLQVLSNNIIGSSGQSLIDISGNTGGVYSNLTVSNELVVGEGSTGTTILNGAIALNGSTTFTNPITSTNSYITTHDLNTSRDVNVGRNLNINGNVTVSNGSYEIFPVANTALAIRSLPDSVGNNGRLFVGNYNTGIGATAGNAQPANIITSGIQIDNTANPTSAISLTSGSVNVTGNLNVSGTSNILPAYVVLWYLTTGGDVRQIVLPECTNITFALQVPSNRTLVPPASYIPFASSIGYTIPARTQITYTTISSGPTGTFSNTYYNASLFVPDTNFSLGWSSSNVTNANSALYTISRL